MSDEVEEFVRYIGIPESDNESYLRVVPDGVDLVLETLPGSNSQQWEMCKREVNYALAQIRVKDIKQDGSPAIVISIHGEGVYRISPFDCEIDSYELKGSDPLVRTSEQKYADRIVLTTKPGFCLPSIIRLDYGQEEGRMYHSCMRIREGHIQYFG